MAILDQVRKLYNNNHKIGSYGGISYDYTCPSPKNYPHQWLWDSCFHSIVLTHFDPERGKKEIETLLLNQKADGFIPCVSIWEKRYPFEEIFYITKISQPPAIPLAVEEIYKKTKDTDFVNEVYPKLKIFMEWYGNNRDSNRNSLAEVIHPWESGIDSTPSFDKQLGIKQKSPGVFRVFSTFFSILFKYFLLGWDGNKILEKKIFLSENVLVNSIYAKSLKSMTFLAKVLQNSTDAGFFEKRYRWVIKALVKNCWSEKEEIFYDLDKNGKQVEVKTISSLMPLILEDLPKRYSEALIKKHLLNKDEFWSEYPIPSVALDDKMFNPGKNLVLWRGPTWVNTNWFLAKALMLRGYRKEAKVVILKTAEMIEKSGFWEFYNPFTGEGYGQPNFGWSSLILDMLTFN